METAAVVSNNRLNCKRRDARQGIGVGAIVKERNSEVIKLKVQLWHATGKERQPPTMTALARELNVSRQYVSKLIAQYTGLLPARGRSARECIKAALLAKALKGRLGAAKLWMRMDREDEGLGQK